MGLSLVFERPSRPVLARLAAGAVVIAAVTGCTSAGVAPYASAVAGVASATAGPSLVPAAATGAPTAAQTTAATAGPTAAATTSVGSGGYGYGDGYGGYGTTSSAPTAAASAPARAGGSALGSREITGVGAVLVAPDGFTVYTYKPDGAGRSTCTGGCAEAWPPLAATAPPALPAGFGGKITLITRDDGSKQVAYDGRPLYRYAGDTGPGQANGQGSGGVWFVVTP